MLEKWRPNILNGERVPAQCIPLTGSVGWLRGRYHRGMSEYAQQRQARWVASAVLLIAVIAIGVAVWALMRPQQPNTPAAAAPSAQQNADAKTRVCAAFNTVRSAVALQTHADLSPDPVAQAVAANARLAMAGGGLYLLGRLDPATPADLADAVRAFATVLQDISMNALAGVGNDDPAQAARLQDGETTSTKVADLCE